MNFRARCLVAVVGVLVALGFWNAIPVGKPQSQGMVLAADATSPGNTDGPGNKDGKGQSSDQSQGKAQEADREEPPYVPKTKRELQRILTRIQFDVTQNEATEPAFKNLYWNNKKAGTYKCVVCDRELFSSKTKYESGTGWPSFYLPIDASHVGTRTDYRLFYSRTEVHCSRCKAHLGHVFDDGPQPSGLRYCMNSASLKFAAEKTDSETNEATAKD